MTSKSEKSYIRTSLLSELPARSDGRGLLDYRSIKLETGVIAQSNGSALINLGKTEVVAASRLEVENVTSGEGIEGGRIDCHVSCSPAAYPRLSSSALDDLQSDYGEMLNSVLSNKSLRPSNLTILAGQKAWCLNLDLIVLSDAGNIYDALFIAARAALSDTRVPLTRPIEFKKAKHTNSIVTDNEESGLDTRKQVQAAADFELRDYWDEGEVLSGRENWPVCITLNLLSSIHFLDATLQEEDAISSRLLVIFSCKDQHIPTVHGMRLLGTGEVVLQDIKKLVEKGEGYARNLCKLLDTKLPENSNKSMNI